MSEFRRYLLEGEQAGQRHSLIWPRNAPMGTVGAQLGKAAGSSLEFMDHREYQPGDDLRRIDWSAYARSDKLTVRLYREEISPHLDIVVDGSKSMALRGSEKLRATIALSAIFATAAANAGYSHRGWITGRGCRSIPNSGERPAAWQLGDFDATESPIDAFKRLPPKWRPRGMRVFITDTFYLGDPLTMLQMLCEQASAAIVVQLLARDDIEPTERGNMRLIDSETRQMHELFVDAIAEKRYRNALSRHQQNWSRAASQVGATFLTIIAENLCDGWDLSELMAREVLKV